MSLKSYLRNFAKASARFSFPAQKPSIEYTLEPRWFNAITAPTDGWLVVVVAGSTTFDLEIRTAEGGFDFYFNNSWRHGVTIPVTAGTAYQIGYSSGPTFTRQVAEFFPAKAFA